MKVSYKVIFQAQVGKFFTFALMTTGVFSQKVGKLFSELKLVTDNLPFVNVGAN